MITIGVDFDGTIADTTKHRLRAVQEICGLVLQPWEMDREVLQDRISAEELRRVKEQFVEQNETLTMHSEPIPFALGWIAQLSKHCAIRLITDRPGERFSYAVDWIAAHGASKYFSSVHSSAGTTKGCVCLEQGCDVLVDDSVRHVTDLVGVTGILYKQGAPRDMFATGLLATSWMEISGIVSGLGREKWKIETAYPQIQQADPCVVGL